MKASVLALVTFGFVWAVQAGDVVLMKTSKGDIRIELNNDKAPITTANFLAYVESKFFDQLTFHRVVPGFVIQGGGHDKDLNEKLTRPPIVNESQNGLSNLRGTLGMARDNNPDSATSQFFINLQDNVRLNYQSPEKPGYAVFARVTEGMDVVDAIAAVPRRTVGEYENVPVEPIIIISVEKLQ